MFWKRETSLCAFTLGEFLGRNPLFWSLATLEIEGKNRKHTAPKTIQAATMAYRKRTTASPKARNAEVMGHTFPGDKTATGRGRRCSPRYETASPVHH